jgi:ribosomal protein L32
MGMKRQRKSGYTPPTPKLTPNELRYHTLSERLIGDVCTRPHLWSPNLVREHWVLARLLGKLHGVTLPAHRRYLEACWEEYALCAADESSCPDCGHYMTPDGACAPCEAGSWRFG